MPDEKKEEQGVEIVGKQKKGVVIIDKNTKTENPTIETHKETGGPC